MKIPMIMAGKQGGLHFDKFDPQSETATVFQYLEALERVEDDFLDHFFDSLESNETVEFQEGIYRLDENLRPLTGLQGFMAAF